MTALHLAALLGYVKVVRLLLAAGADVTLEDNRGQTALSLASSTEHDEVAHMIRSHMQIE